ncbi:MAG: hydrogenase maturation protease [Elainellaceae cyanobacterium]
MAPPCSLLIIGYGNELRGDDAVGPRVARAVDELQLTSVRILALHQLAPELAADLSEVDIVIFIDACCDKITVQLDQIDVSSRALRAVETHSCSPVTLLSLVGILYGKHPQTWLLQIPATSFDIGDPLSGAAYDGCRRALEILEQFITVYQQSCTRSV